MRREKRGPPQPSLSFCISLSLPPFPTPSISPHLDRPARVHGVQHPAQGQVETLDQDGRLGRARRARPRLFLLPHGRVVQGEGGQGGPHPGGAQVGGGGQGGAARLPRLGQDGQDARRLQLLVQAAEGVRHLGPQVADRPADRGGGGRAGRGVQGGAKPGGFAQGAQLLGKVGGGLRREGERGEREGGLRAARRGGEVFFSSLRRAQMCARPPSSKPPPRLTSVNADAGTSPSPPWYRRPTPDRKP